MKQISVTFAFLLVLAASMAAYGQQHGTEPQTPARPQSPTTTQQQATRDATRENCARFSKPRARRSMLPSDKATSSLTTLSVF